MTRFEDTVIGRSFERTLQQLEHEAFLAGSTPIDVRIAVTRARVAMQEGLDADRDSPWIAAFLAFNDEIAARKWAARPRPARVRLREPTRRRMRARRGPPVGFYLWHLDLEDRRRTILTVRGWNDYR